MNSFIKPEWQNVISLDQSVVADICVFRALPAPINFCFVGAELLFQKNLPKLSRKLCGLGVSGSCISTRRHETTTANCSESFFWHATPREHLLENCDIEIKNGNSRRVHSAKWKTFLFFRQDLISSYRIENLPAFLYYWQSQPK